MRLLRSPLVVTFALLLATTAFMLSPWGTSLGYQAAHEAQSSLQAVGDSFGTMFPSATQMGPLPADQRMDVGVGVPLHNPSGLDAYIQATQTPNSPLYHQFLTPSEFTSQYAPSSAAYSQAVQYFQGYGITPQVSSDRLLIGLSGTPAQMGAAFHTSFAQFQMGGQVYYGTTGTATLPSGLYVSGVFGLTNAFNARPVYATGPSSPSSTATSAPSSAGSTSTVPGTPLACASALYGGYTPTEIWDAYRLNVLMGAGDKGSGEKIAVVDAYDTAEPPTTLASDLNSFDSGCGVSAVTPQFQYPVPFPASTNSSATSNWGGETDLDMQWSHAMAESAALYPVQTPDAGFSLYMGVNYLVDTHLVDVISLSWGFNDVGLYWNTGSSSWCNPSAGLGGCNASAAGVYAIFHPVLQAAVAEGISVTVASGDCGADDGANIPSTDYPASDEDATGIGGSVLTLASNTTFYGSETASLSGQWSGNRSGSACTNGGAAGGGWAPTPQPWYQSGPGVKNKGLRGVPDVGVVVGSPLVTYSAGSAVATYGTSAGAPQWAGLIATADGMAGHDLGLINPALYAMLRSPAYASGGYFHQITTGSNGYSAAADWTPISGVGTPIDTEVLPYLAGNAFHPNPNSLQAGFTASAMSGSTPLTVTFTVTPTGGTGTYPKYNFYWGDGTSVQTKTNVLSHTYSSAGTYDAQAEVYDSAGNSSTTVALAITAGTTPTMTLSLAASTTTPTVGQMVTFTATTTGGTSPFTFGYFFGDGSWVFGGYSAKTTSPNSVGHPFGAAGVYCADATANDSSSPQQGATSNVLTILVGGATGSCPTVSSPLAITASSNVTSGNAPLTVGFGSSPSGGSGTYSSFAWTFGDGTTGTGQNPTHQYTTTGTFQAWVVVTDSKGAVAVSSHLNITVSSASSLIATAGATPTSGAAPLTVSFNATASGGAPAYVWFWGFGDGAKSALRNPSHSYTVAGTFTATLIVNDTAGHSYGTSAPAVTVTLPQLKVTASATPTSGNSPLSVSFASVPTGGTGSYSSYAWTFGDGTTGTGANPTHTYTVTTAQTFSAYVVVTDSSGATATSNTLSISVAPTGAALTVSATSNRSSGYSALAVSFTSAPTGGSGSYSSFAWTFGDGGTSVLQNPAHSYLTPGHYNATVTVTDSKGATATSNKVPIAVWNLPGAALAVLASASTTSGHAPLTVAFTSSPSGGSGSYTSYSWNFGDGTTSTQPAPSHTYTTAQTYSASVVVTDSTGATATSNTLTITVSPTVNPTPLTGSLAASPSTLNVGGLVVLTANPSGGTSPYHFSWSGLPPGCTGADQSTLNCVPSVAGTYPVSVVISDSSSTPQQITRMTNITVTSTASPAPSSGIFGVDPVLFAILILAVVATVVIVALLVHRSRKVPPQSPPEPWTPGPPPGS